MQEMEHKKHPTASADNMSHSYERLCYKICLWYRANKTESYPDIAVAGWRAGGPQGGLSVSCK